MTRMPTAHRTHRTSGFTLIEVMVALIILVMGVLGAAGMTVAALRDSKQAALRSTATALAYEVSDLMRANPGQEAVFTGASATSTTTCWTTGCTPALMAKNDYYVWQAKLTGANGLPNGAAVICHDATMLTTYPACDNSAAAPLVVKVRWDEKNNNAPGAANPVSIVTRFVAVTIQPYAY